MAKTNNDQAAKIFSGLKSDYDTLVKDIVALKEEIATLKRTKSSCSPTTLELIGELEEKDKLLKKLQQLADNVFEWAKEHDDTDTNRIEIMCKAYQRYEGDFLALRHLILEEHGWKLVEDPEKPGTFYVEKGKGQPTAVASPIQQTVQTILIPPTEPPRLAKPKWPSNWQEAWHMLFVSYPVYWFKAFSLDRYVHGFFRIIMFSTWLITIYVATIALMQNVQLRDAREQNILMKRIMMQDEKMRQQLQHIEWVYSDKAVHQEEYRRLWQQPSK